MKLWRDAAFQILAQKAEWEIKSQTDLFDDEGIKIDQETYDPKTILIIGNSINEVKAETNESYPDLSF